MSKQGQIFSLLAHLNFHMDNCNELAEPIVTTCAEAKSGGIVAEWIRKPI